ncbi:MAG: hypothetical protein AAGK37_16410 [Pseudomonadota bacterium]
MSQVLKGIGSRLPDPRKLFAAAVVLGAIALFLGYVQYHDRADRDLALRQDPPAAVALQDFSASLHTGPTDELLVHAEAGFDQTFVLSVPGADPVRRALVAPLFPLSEVGQALIDAQSDGSKTALTAQVARRTGDGAAARPAAIGLLFHPLEAGGAAPEDPAVLARSTFGAGLNGTVVALNGWVVKPADLGLMAAGAFTADGTMLAGGYLAIQPFSDGRAVALAAIPNSQTFLIPAVLALVLVLIGIVTAMRREPQVSAPMEYDEEYSDMGEMDLEAHAAHPKFAPIPSQREIVEAAAARAPEEPNWFFYWGAALLRVVWRGVRLLGALTIFCGRALRNRLLPREDEAL